MKLVVDANIVFSAIIKDGKTRKLLFDESLKLFSPEFLMEELHKYESMLIEKASITDAEFHRILDVLQRRIQLVNHEEIENFMKESKAFSPDIKDGEYFALALKL